MIYTFLLAAATNSPATVLTGAEIAEVEAQARTAADAVADEVEQMVRVSEARLALCRRSTTADDELDRYPARFGGQSLT